jgi:hemolysin activation/secretion protein
MKGILCNRRCPASNSFWLVACGIALALNALSPECEAQQPPPTGVRPGDRPLPEPKFERPPAKPDLLPKLPAEPPSKQRRRLSEGIAVPIDKIILKYTDSNGDKTSPVFSEAQRAELRETILKKYEEKLKLTTEDLVALRNEITLFYYNCGYVNSGAVIPDQDVSNRHLTVILIQGQLPVDQIQIKGLKHLRERYVKKRVEFGVEKPLNVNPLQDRLQLMLRDPSIDNIQASLRPGTRPGDSRLEIEVTEAPLFEFGILTNNDRPPSVGEYQGVLVGKTRNVLGLSDPFEIAVSLTQGLKNGYFAYELPVWSGLPFSAEDLRLFVNGEITDADVVEEPFDALDIESETKTIEFGLRYPLYKAIENVGKGKQDEDNGWAQKQVPGITRVWEKEFSLSLSFARRHSESFLLDRPFSFSAGVQNGESDIAVLRFGQNGFLRSEEQVFVARSTLSFGLDTWGATINDTGPDGEFFSWLGQAQWVRRYPMGDKNTQLFLRSNIQLTADPLLPIEQFSVGGFNTVRGYRRNQLVRDNGWVASAEWRLPVYQFSVPGLSRTPEDGWLWFAPFFDIGGGWNQDRPTPDPDAIYSVGAGVLWRLSTNMSAEVYYGYPIQDVIEPEDKSLQDYGIYFSVQSIFDFGSDDVANFF